MAEIASVAASENDEGLKELDACFESLAPSSHEVYELATTISQAEAFLRANEHYNAPASNDGGESDACNASFANLQRLRVRGTRTRRSSSRSVRRAQR